MKTIAMMMFAGLCVAVAACGGPKPEDPSTTTPTYATSSGSASEGPAPSASGTPESTTPPVAPVTPK